MSYFPVITEDKQKLYEIECINNGLKNKTPIICGYYGRACRNLNKEANSFLCNGCSLAEYVKNN